ncbi:hypothetical protein CGLO_13167 [Colletotrichum gloeosporioides Cg-14]|uniref:Uncharacterized protein n=1 Tax=Colletotrichum gloeosporioides (strain Cg-14) TaxID=1237896 RepID=T0LHK2_COLGC|nr:hypothetical protein CGLO_13167 [Colletotrichum gloeosporioides Cg-14]
MVLAAKMSPIQTKVKMQKAKS